ncbi:MAG: hypothetical protein IJD96_01195 [Lachnospiraceae bacterium]|nr:hypothetical protein [Lachnospiraceae bacterium]
MKRVKGFAIGMFALITVCGLCGCKEEVVTVADMQLSEEQTTEYVEIQEFVLKEEAEASGREEVMHCAVMIPVGYYPSEEIPGMYLHEMAPLDSSNVYYSVVEGDGGLVSDTLTKEEYKQELEQAFQEQGQSVSVEVSSFEEVDMDGVPAYKIRSAYETEGNRIQQLTYMILGEDTYTVTYSQSEDDELMADFAVSDGKIRLVTEQDVQMANAGK